MSTTFDRIHQILELLHKHQDPMTLSEIMQDLSIDEVQRRTMQLTIKEMLTKKLIVQIETKHKRHPKYMTGAGAAYFPDMIEGVEKLSWYIAKGWLENLTAVDNHAKNIAHTDSEKERRELEYKQEVRVELDKRFPGHIFDFAHTFGQMDMKRYKQDIVSGLLKAIPHNIMVTSQTPADFAWLTIEKGDAKTTLLIAPYFLFLFNGELYVACYRASLQKGYTKAFKGVIINVALRNIHKANLEQFPDSGEIHPPMPAYQSFKEEFHKKQIGVWGSSKNSVKIVLQIDHHMAEFFAHRYWHSSQTIEWNADKTSCTLTVHVPITHDLITWVWQWHPYVRVEEPQELIDELLTKAQESLQHYGKAITNMNKG